jgi:hypothetical protein
MPQAFAENIDHFDPRNPYAGDDKAVIQFLMGTRLDDGRTAAEGRPIYMDEEFIKIFNSKDNIIERPVRDSDKQRWPRQYQAWKLTGESTPGAAGTRLEFWPQMTRAQVEEFKYFKIFTVEQLAEAPDSSVGKLPGITKLKQLAKAHMETARGELPLLKMQMQLDAKDGEVEELKAEVRRLTKMVEKMAQPA